MKRVISILLTIFMITAMFTACNTAGSDLAEAHDASQYDRAEDDGYHTLYFKDKDKSLSAVATFYNNYSSVSEDVTMEKVSEDDSSVTFSCKGNVKEYNMVYITCGDKRTSSFAFNRCVSGWYNSDDGLLPYTEGQEINYYPEFDHVDMDCNGYEKAVNIWKPGDYDASSAKKYSTVYVLDGQSMAMVGKAGQTLDDCEVVTEQVNAMISSTGYDTIVVAIDTFGDMRDVSRDDELVPDIGELSPEVDVPFTDQKGAEFASFVADTLVPYIQQNYNVYTDALHTSVAGASLGGLEAFYITLEYPEIFGTVGALSPSFWTYDDPEWREYLKKKTFDSNSPLLYLYTGPAGGDTDPYVTQMYERLQNMGYDKDKLILDYNDIGGHNTKFWRAVFSEFLEAMVFRCVEPLQNQR